MKKQIAVALAALLLSGCGAEATFETVADEMIQPVLAEVREIYVSLPPEAAAPVLEGEEGSLYVCEDYEICLQTLASGDLAATIQTITGYMPEELTILQTRQSGAKRYDFVWVSAGEQGDLVGKGCILDDGNYHYAVTVLGNADTANAHQPVWQEILDSVTVG